MAAHSDHDQGGAVGDWTGAGIEHLVLSEDDDGIVAESGLGTTESGGRAAAGGASG